MIVYANESLERGYLCKNFNVQLTGNLEINAIFLAFATAKSFCLSWLLSAEHTNTPRMPKILRVFWWLRIPFLQNVKKVFGIIINNSDKGVPHVLRG